MGRRSPRPLITATSIHVCLGAVIILSGCGFDDELASRGTSPAAQADTTTSPSDEAEGEAQAESDDEPAPEPVDPRTGSTYCETLELLIQYSNTDYGLDTATQTVDGEAFAERLATVAGMYEGLAEKAESESSEAWSELAEATLEAENVLRAATYRVDSDMVIVELAELAELTGEKLPVATEGANTECGVDTADLQAVGRGR